MNPRRDTRNSRAALFDSIEEGGIRASSSYSSQEIDEHENGRAMDGLQDRVNLLKRLSGDIHEEVETHNRMLDRMGNDMDSSRGILSGTMDRFKIVFETKSSRRMITLVASFLFLFLVVYYLTSDDATGYLVCSCCRNENCGIYNFSPLVYKKKLLTVKISRLQEEFLQNYQFMQWRGKRVKHQKIKWTPNVQHHNQMGRAHQYFVWALAQLPLLPPQDINLYFIF